MNWQHLFDFTTLQKGRDYYDDGRVKLLSSSEPIITAIVSGHDPYLVRMIPGQKQPRKMTCSCPHAASGYRCKHMAAVLYALEDSCTSTFPDPISSYQPEAGQKALSKAQANPKAQILPILKISENEIKLYTTLSNYRNSPYRAPLFNDCKITHTPEGLYLIEGLNGFTTRETQSILLDPDFRINNFACTCPEFQSASDHRLCLHLNALLHHINDLRLPLQDIPYQKELSADFPVLFPIPKGESMDQKKERLKLQKLVFQAERTEKFYAQTQRAENQIPLFSIQNQMESGIDIAAYLHYENAMPYLSFQVIGEAAYKIKNLTRFLNLIRGGEFYRYGQKLAFYHTLESFTPTARRLIALLMNNDAVSTATASVFLYNLDLDSLFDIFSENPDLLFDLNLDEITQTFEFQISEYEPNYYILHSPESFADLTLMSKYGYFFSDGVLSRVHCHDISALHLLTILNGYLHSQVIFGESLYPQILTLVQRANGETIADTTILRYKLDIDKRNIRIQIEGNPSSPLAEAVGNALRCNGAAFKNDAYYFSGINQELLNQLTENLSNYGEVWVSEELKAYHRIYKAPADISVRQNGNLLSIDIQSNEFDLKETIAILKSFRRKKEYHRLKNGETIKLDHDSWQNFSDFLDNQGIRLTALEKKETQLPMYQLLSLSAETEMNIDFEPHLSEKLDYFHEHGSHTFPLPPAIVPVLKPYQKEGVQFLKLLEALDFNGILADDMGLGKTLQTLTLLSETTSQTSLIICPASLIYNWRDEVFKFFPQMTIACTLGEKEERLAIWQTAERYQLIITSYDYLLRDIEDMINIPFYYVVLDESQRIKNMQTKSAKAAKRLSSQHRLALSGTPIENNLAELWSVFDFLMPGYLYSYSRFRKQFELPIVRAGDEKATKKLSNMVKPFVLRRLKKDVLDDLPEKYETILTITPSPEEKRVYQAHEASIKTEVSKLLQESGGEVSIEILALLTRLRLLCCDRSLVEDTITAPGSKVKACLKMIEDLNKQNRQILVFSSFTKVLDLLAFELKKAGISHNILQGSTPKEQRHQLVNDFQNDAFSVFLISLKAGGTGLNLTSAQAVIHFDPWWNKAAMNQATDRAYRIGQKQSVEVYSLLVAGTIEERIFELQNKKWELAEQLIGGQSKALTSMNREEVMKLFE